MTRLLFLLLAVGCPTPDADPEFEACAVANDTVACPACSDGEVTCRFGDVEATANSCGDCQAMAALYVALCDAGESATEAAIEAGASCGPATATEN